MFGIDLLPVMIVAIFLLFFNAIMTIIFLNQRLGLRKYGVSIIPIFCLIFGLIIYVQLHLGPKGDAWILIYAITITVLVIIDRIAKLRRLKKHTSK